MAPDVSLYDGLAVFVLIQTAAIPPFRPFLISAVHLFPCTMANAAAWIKQARAPLEVAESETPTPGEGEVLVRVMVIAFSPIESMIQR